MMRICTRTCLVCRALPKGELRATEQVEAADAEN